MSNTPQLSWSDASLVPGDRYLDLHLQLSRKYHPDHNPNNEANKKRYLKISKAYEVLSDKLKRKVYDMKGMDGVAELDRLKV